MPSLVELALGNDFSRLHPRLQERHSFSSSDGLHSVGSGVLQKVWQGSKLFTPFLLIGSTRNIMFPQSGEAIPFEIKCFAYKDSFGRETLSLNRTFFFDVPRRFDEYLVAGANSNSLTLYAGTHQHLAVKMNLSVCARGGLVATSGRQRLRTFGMPLPFPLLLSGIAEVHEWHDEAAACFNINGVVRNRLFGEVFGFVGSFRSEIRRLDRSGVPESVMPVTENPHH